MIEIKGLKKSFGVHQVLKGIDLSIKKGEIFFILGTSGTGKSVLLKILVGLMRATEGQVILDGEKITQISEDEYRLIRRKCGMVFQSPALFDSMTVYENVAYGIRRHLKLSQDAERERVEKCLNLVQLSGISERMPQDISYGMQKRVSLARTIAVEPQVLLFDEPTTGLDPITTKAINQLILNLSRTLNTTSIVVSHDMHCALAIADRIVVLDQGQIAAIGAPKEVQNSAHPLVREFMAEVNANA